MGCRQRPAADVDGVERPPAAQRQL
jgi:hypothetical protein